MLIAIIIILLLLLLLFFFFDVRLTYTHCADYFLYKSSQDNRIRFAKTKQKVLQRAKEEGVPESELRKYIQDNTEEPEIKTSTIVETLMGRKTWVYNAKAGTFDIDYNLHLSNSKYFAIIDSARTQMCLATGLFHGGVVDKKYLVIANVSTSFRKEIPAFSKFEIHTKVVGYDETSFTLEHAFVSPQKPGTERKLYCVMLARIGITGKGTTRRIYENLGLRVSDRRMGKLPPSYVIPGANNNSNNNNTKEGESDIPDQRDASDGEGVPQFDDSSAPWDTVPLSRAVPGYVEMWHQSIGDLRNSAKKEFGL